MIVGRSDKCMVLKIAPSVEDHGIFYKVYDIDVPFNQDKITYYGSKYPRIMSSVPITKFTHFIWTLYA